MIVVTKFGGSSLSCATQFKKVKNIVLSSEKRKIVVVSALGKRNKDDTKITDLLYILHAHLKYSVPYEDIWNMIYSRFVGVKNELEINYDIESELNKLHNELSKSISEDYLVSRGEYLTALLMSSFLGYTFVDASSLISFGYDGILEEKTTSTNIKNAFEKYGSIVIPGFYGSYPNGQAKLLSRGGSDVTGAIIASSLNAELYENWTDVSGILAADPKIVPSPKAIKEITYVELRELSYMGASVLHEETVFPVQQMNIPINLKNTNDPENPGTLIKNICNDDSNIVTGIAGKKDFVSFNVFKNHLSNEIGFLRKSLSIFERYNVSVEHIPSGIDSFSVVVSKESVEKCKFDIITELKKELAAEITIEDDIALVAIVGRNMAKRAGICGTIFSTLGSKNINIKLLAQGPSELNIIIGVSSNDYNLTVRTLYDNLIGNE